MLLVTTVTMDSQDMGLNLEPVSHQKTGVDKNHSVNVRIFYFSRFHRYKTEMIFTIERSYINFVGTCSVLQSPSNGRVSYNKNIVGGRYPVNTVASFTCNRGYNRNGHNSRTCESSGNWNRQTPTCNRGN